MTHNVALFYYSVFKELQLRVVLSKLVTRKNVLAY